MNTSKPEISEITRRDFLKVGGASLALLGLSQGLTHQVVKALGESWDKSGQTSGKPNIIWIVMDTTRADHLSCYGTTARLHLTSTG